MPSSSAYLWSDNTNLQIHQKLDDMTFMGAPVEASGFYLLDENDSYRLGTLSEVKRLPGLGETIRLYSTRSGLSGSIRELSDNRYCVLYSSSNQYDLNSARVQANTRSLVKVVYYLDEENKKWIPIKL